MIQRKYTDEIRDKIWQAHELGKTVRQIHLEMGIPAGTVGSIITRQRRKLKLAAPTARRRTTKKDAKEIRRLAKEGVPNNAIAKKLGIGYGTVCRIAKRKPRRWSAKRKFVRSHVLVPKTEIQATDNREKNLELEVLKLKARLYDLEHGKL